MLEGVFFFLGLEKVSQAGHLYELSRMLYTSLFEFFGKVALLKVLNDVVAVL